MAENECGEAVYPEALIDDVVGEDEAIAAWKRRRDEINGGLECWSLLPKAAKIGLLKDLAVLVRESVSELQDVTDDHAESLDTQADLAEARDGLLNDHTRRIRDLTGRFDRLEALEAHNGNQLNALEDRVSEVINSAANYRISLKAEVDRRLKRLEAQGRHPSGTKITFPTIGLNDWTVPDSASSVSVKAGTPVYFR